MNNSTLFGLIKNILVACMLPILCNGVYAQKKADPIKMTNQWSININGGYSQFWGYINTKDFVSLLNHQPTFGYGIALGRQISPTFGIRGEVTAGNLKVRKNFVGIDDSYSTKSYTGNYIELNISGKLSLTDLISGYKPNRAFTIYGLGGLGVSNFEGNTYNHLTNETFGFGYGSGKGLKGYEIDGMATLGFGVSVKLFKAVNFTFENSFKFIDANKLKEKKGLLHFDSYSYSSVGLSYHFGSKKEAPVSVPVQPKPVAQENKPVEVKKEPVPTPAKTEPVIEVKKEAPVVAPVKEEPKVTPVEPAKQQAAEKPVEKASLFTGYKIQILATLKPAGFEKIMLQYHLKEQIREDHTDKWYRYSVGEFKSYKEALAYRKVLYLRNKIKDSFIVKIVDGKRVLPAKK